MRHHRLTRRGIFKIEEVWKDIEGYEGYYQVSDFGRVKSLDRTVKYKDDRVYNYKGRYIKSYITKGYYHVILSINSNTHTFRVNRLVAKAFLPNPYNLPEVNHKDENKLNNKSDNLEWCTFEYNQQYGTRLERLIKSTAKYKKKIKRYSKDGKYLDEWVGVRNVAKLFGIDRRSIQRCCNGKLKSAGGYYWKYSLN